MMDADRIASLSSFAVFAGIPDDAVEAMCSHGRVLSFDTNHVLFERGGDAEELMILQEGVAELLFPVEIMGVTRNMTIESKQAGDVVAWSALVPPYRFRLSGRCASKCTLTSFRRDELQSFFATDPQTGYLFMRNLSCVIGRRFQVMQTMWLHDLQASAARRLG